MECKRTTISHVRLIVCGFVVGTRYFFCSLRNFHCSLYIFFFRIWGIYLIRFKNLYVPILQCGLFLTLPVYCQNYSVWHIIHHFSTRINCFIHSFDIFHHIKWMYRSIVNDMQKSDSKWGKALSSMNWIFHALHLSFLRWWLIFSFVFFTALTRCVFQPSSFYYEWIQFNYFRLEQSKKNDEKEH